VRGERAARSRLVAALAGRGIAGDGAPQGLRGRVLLAVRAEHGGTRLGGRRGPRPAVPEPGDLLDTLEKA
jgi:hypothetical protein